MAEKRAPGIRLRISLDPDIAIGPGKARLLEGIRDTGSIAAAGRGMGMSYKRAWLLVNTMNACFRKPLVSASRGGSQRGGAVLTPEGVTVLALFRGMEKKTATAIAPEMRRLRRRMRVMSERK